jgi:hypothetical protein
VQRQGAGPSAKAASRSMPKERSMELKTGSHTTVESSAVPQQEVVPDSRQSQLRMASVPHGAQCGNIIRNRR